MGMYNMYGRRDIVQLKVGSNLVMQVYSEGDEVDISDGIYVSYEGVVVVHEGKLLRVFNCMYDKWGGVIDVRSVINDRNPLMQTMNEIERKYKNKGE